MQTFLPHPDFTESAKCLDYRRLGKQRVECIQLLNALRGETSAWANHPACKMWRGHEYALAEYGVVICQEWRRRGYRDTCMDKLIRIRDQYCDNGFPSWFGNKAFHASHRSNLLRKDPTHYRAFGWSEPPTLEYVWPIPVLK